MEINLWVVGIGVTLSVLGFFLKRMKEEIETAVEKINRSERKVIELETKVKLMDKLLEDRRQDIKNLYEKTG